MALLCVNLQLIVFTLCNNKKSLIKGSILVGYWYSQNPLWNFNFVGLKQEHQTDLVWHHKCWEQAEQYIATANLHCIQKWIKGE